MSDFIRREDVIDALKKRWNNMSRTAKLEELVWAIEEVPSIELEERTVKVDSITFSINPPDYIWKCSKCGQYFYQTSWGNPVNYCSSCGAKLKWK